jgi:hypothetical protein
VSYDGIIKLNNSWTERIVGRDDYMMTVDVIRVTETNSVRWRLEAQFMQFINIFPIVSKKKSLAT